jgi:hypothetical protein
MSIPSAIATLVIAMSIPSAITGFSFWAIERKIDRRQKEQDTKDEARRKNEVIVIESVNAALALSEATARAVQRIPDAQCNGDMDAALDYADQIKHKHRDFMTEQGINALY